MPATVSATDDGVPGKTERYHLYELLAVFGTALMAYWWFFI